MTKIAIFACCLFFCLLLFLLFDSLQYGLPNTIGSIWKSSTTIARRYQRNFIDATLSCSSDKGNQTPVTLI